MYKVYLDQQLIHDLDSENNVLVNPTLELELNKAGSFTFSMECTHPYYDKLERFKSIIQVLCDGDEIFKGRIIEITDDMYKERTVYCESELAYLNDTIQRPYEYHLAASAVYEYLQAVIGSHNGQVDDARQFTLGEITVNDPNDYIYCYTNYNSTMDEIKEDLVDDLGGYIRIRNEYRNNDPLGTLTGRYIDYINLEEYGRTSEQSIEFGENLLDFSNDINQADICTGIIPLGATLEESEYAAIEERVTIESVNSGSDYITIPEAVAKYGLILKVVTWDDITEPSNLLKAGQAYLEEYDYEPQTITATAVDMHLTDEEIESWRLGDKIFVESEPHDLHKRFPLAQMSIPLDQPENTSVTLGTYEDTSLSGRTNRTETGLRNFENFQIGNVIASAVAQATAIIDQHTNGYVTIHYDEERGCADEILIMDTPSTDTATRVWRWNLNGLGYSSTGYSGDDAAYGTAITMNGWILGTFIIANGMILADDNEATFGKFTNNGIEIYAQSGREDLLLMTVGREGMEIYDDTGQNILATFYSDGVCIYGAELGSRRFQSSYSLSPNRTNTYNISLTGEVVIGVESLTVTVSGYTAGTDFEYEYELSVANQTLSVMVTSKISSSTTCTINATLTTQTSNYKMMQLNGNGMRVFDKGGAMRSSLDSDSFDVYDSDENLLMTLNRNGLLTYDSDGTMRSNLSRTSFYVYNSDGNPSMCLTTNGTTYYSDGNAIGSVGTNTLHSYPNEHGLVFDLEYGDDYMSFAHMDSSGADVYTIKFAYYAPSCSYPEGVAFGDNARMNNYKLYLHDSNSGGYFVATNSNDGAFSGGDFYFNDGSLYYNGYEVATKRDIANLSLLSNGEEAVGEFCLYSGLQLDISELVNYKSSDETLKTSIQPISDARVDNITPVTFKWKSGDDTPHYGYIAQEVREHIPEIVKENDDGLLSLAYTEIIPLLHAKINTLEDRIAKLEAIIYGKEKI